MNAITSNEFIARQIEQSGELVECIRSGQATPEQVEAHYAAGDVAQPKQPTAQPESKAAQEKRQPLPCVWTEQDDEFMPGTYASACGEMWSFTDGGVADNNVRFCQGCGKSVEVHGIKA